MEKLPCISVIDFITWIDENIEDDDIDDSILSGLSDDNKDYQVLKRLANDYLRQTKRNAPSCTLRNIIILFLSSKEFENVINHCERNCNYYLSKETPNWSFRRCIRCREFEFAFRMYVDRLIHYDTVIQNNCNASELAECARELLKDDKKQKSSKLLNIMVNSKIEISEEVDFLDWLNNKKKNPQLLKTIPTSYYEKLVNEYIEESRKGEKEKKQLIKAYRQSGWDSIIEHLQIKLKCKRKRYTKSIEEVIERYFYNRAEFNCLILPLYNTISQNRYKDFINNYWNDINALTENYLDVFYSEKDFGKSGYELAKNISYLPDNLDKMAPCIVIWKNSIKEAKAIRINELSSDDIFNIITFIVEKIQEAKNMDQIVKETSKRVKELQLIKNGVNYISIEPQQNIVGDNNTNNSLYVSVENSYSKNEEETIDIDKLVMELDEATKKIKESVELSEAHKEPLLQIMKDAKEGVIENSNEKTNRAKQSFNTIKSFLKTISPKVIEVLANLTQIAMFFGLSKTQ